MAAPGQRIGRAVLELITDKSLYSKGLAEAKTELTGLEKNIKSFATQHQKSLSAIGQGFALAAAGITAATAAAVALGRRGADVNDVADAFAGLSARAGESASVMLGALQRGTKNTISNFELMKAANKAMGAGLVASSRDFETLAAGAHLLANRTGEETVEAFDSLTTAMAKGRTATLKQFGLFVDSKEAVEQYAKAHRVAVGDMNDAQRAAALQAGTLAALRRELTSAGEDVADFADNIDQLTTRWTNFTDELGSAIAKSPVIAELMRGIGEAIDAAFGKDQAERVQTLTDLVNTLALGTADFMSVMLELGRQGSRVWVFLKDGILGLLEAQFRVRAAMRDLIPIAQYRQEAAELRAMADSLKSQVDEAWQGQMRLEGTLNATSSALDAMRARMAQASKAKTELGTATAGATTRTLNFAAAAGVSAKALEKEAAAADKAAAAYRSYKNFVGEREIEDIERQRNEQQKAIAEGVRDDAEALNDRIDRLSEYHDKEDAARRATLEANRDAARTASEIEFERAEFAIEQAKRTGATWQQIYAMEKALADARLQRAIEEAEEEFRIRADAINRTTVFGEAEYQALERAHNLAIQQMLETHQRAEIAKRQELQRTGSLWRRMLSEMRIADRLIDAATSNLFSTLFTRNRADDSHVKELQKTAAELQTTADIARQTYERMSKDGRASAEAVHRAWQDMREKEEAASKAHRDAEEAANVQAASKWKAYWDGLKTTFTSILDDMLAYFTRQFIGGLIKALAGQRLGQALGGFLGGVGGGGGGIGGLFGQGGGIAMSAASSGLFASGGASAGLASGEAINATTAGLAGGGSGGGMGFLSNPAFWSNPWTIAGIGGFALGMAIWKKGLFRGGEEALKVSPRRDQFFAQFGDVQNRGVGGAAHNLAAKMTAFGAGEGGGPLFAALQQADTVKKWEAAQAAVVAFLAEHRLQVKSYMRGGFVPPGVVQPAVLHGGRRGELIVPLDRVQTSAPARPIIIENHISMEVRTNDATDFQRVFDGRVVPALMRHLATNGPVVEAIRRSQET